MNKNNSIETEELGKVSLTEQQLIEFVQSLNQEETEVFYIIFNAVVQMSAEQSKIFCARSSREDMLRNWEIAWQIHDEAEGAREDYYKIFIERILNERIEQAG